jgi:tetratricopeptide (TPR) repeat protein
MVPPAPDAENTPEQEHFTFEAKLLFAKARAEQGFSSWDSGFTAGANLVGEAMQALDEAAAMVEPSTPAPDIVALHALRAYLFTRVGFLNEADAALELALRDCDRSGVRSRDLLGLARALMRRGRHTRADEVLRLALEGASSGEELLEGRILLGQCALKLDRPAEAEAISAEALKALSGAPSGSGGDARIAAEQVHVEALLARDQASGALAFIDEALQPAGALSALRPAPEEPPPSQIDRERQRTILRLPLFARVLRRAGRPADAEILLRKLIGMPLVEGAYSIGEGLQSRSVLRAFLDEPAEAIRLAPEMRASLIVELTRALRDQGRHHEAVEINSAFRGRSEP